MASAKCFGLDVDSLNFDLYQVPRKYFLQKKSFLIQGRVTLGV